MSVALTLGSSALRAQPVEPQSGGLALDLRCPALTADPELAAELEARAILELGLVSTGGGQLEVACAGNEARIRWTPRGGSTREGVVALEQGAARPVDSILTELRGLAETSPPAAPPTAPDAAPPPPAAAPAAAPAPAPQGLTWGPLVGVSGEPWSGSVSAVIGPHLGLRAETTRSLAFGVDASLRWGIAGSPPQTVRSHELGLQVSGSTLSDHLELRLGLSGGWASFGAPTGATPGSRSAPLLRLGLRPSATVPAGSLVVALGPDCSVYLVRPTARLDGDEVAGARRLTVGGVLELRARPPRSR